MELKIYRCKIGDRRPRKIKAWDALDAKIKYLKATGHWNLNHSEIQNQRFLDAVKIEFDK